MPSKSEMEFGLKTLAENDYKVDYIITHCCPQSVASSFSRGMYKPDELTKYFDTIAEKVEFDKWLCRHYHMNERFLSKYYILYGNFMRIE